MGGSANEPDRTVVMEPDKTVVKPAVVRPAAVKPVVVKADAESTKVEPLKKPTAIGDVVAEKYRLVRSLGRGGMGRIFAADHLHLRTTVALKFMHPHLARERGAVARFQREGRAAAKLKSRHATRIIDVGQLPSGELYIVMEYLEGTSLDTMLVEGRGLPIADAVTYLIQACDAVAEAHDESIVHRDIKPANLFLTKGKNGEPVIKVLDFGLAKSTSTDAGSFSGVSEAGLAPGTPYYMAPEQITGASPTDGRTDVWAIGATLYELLTGRLAFAGPGAAVVFAQVLNGKPQPIRNVRQDIPDAVVAIIDRCLTTDPAGRFQSVRDLARALEGSLETSSLSGRPTSTAPAPWQPSRPPPPMSVPSSAPTPTATMPAPWVPSRPPPPMPALPVVPNDLATVRAVSFSSGPPSMPEIDAGPESARGPTAAQTAVAALAGPALIAIAAGVLALVVGTDVVGTNLFHRGGAARAASPVESPTFITAKSRPELRAKAPAAPEKPEKPEKPARAERSK